MELIITILLGYFLAPLVLIAYVIGFWVAVAIGIVWIVLTVVDYYKTNKKGEPTQTEGSDKNSPELSSRNEDQPKASH